MIQALQSLDPSVKCIPSANRLLLYSSWHIAHPCTSMYILWLCAVQYCNLCSLYPCSSFCTILEYQAHSPVYRHLMYNRKMFGIMKLIKTCEAISSQRHLISNTASSQHLAISITKRCAHRQRMQAYIGLLRAPLLHWLPHVHSIARPSLTVIMTDYQETISSKN
jgi:hypothetical protein